MAAKNDSFIHVRLEYEEVIKSKRDILSSELDIINIIKSMNKYVALRNAEFDLKAQFYREIKKIAMEIKMLEAALPHIKVPKILGPSEEKPAERMIVSKDETGLEEQLREIQRRLKALS